MTEPEIVHLEPTEYGKRVLTDGEEAQRAIHEKMVELGHIPPDEPESRFYSRTKASKDDYGTPAWLYDRLDETFQFNLDLAANAENTKCKFWLGPGSSIAEDALACSWQAIGDQEGGLRGFLNPPFKGPNGEHWMDRWMAKCYSETRRRGFVVAVIRAAIETDWWQDFVENKAFIFPALRGRVNYVGGDSGSTFPSAVVLFMPPLERDRKGHRHVAPVPS